MQAAPVALIWTILLAFTCFHISNLSFKETVAVVDALMQKCIQEGFHIALIVFDAFVIPPPEENRCH